MERRNNLNKVIIDLCRKLDPSLDVTRVIDAWQTYRTHLETKVAKEGKRQACSLFKQLNNIAVRIATGDAWTTPPFCKTNREGVPALLKKVMWLLRSSDPQRKRIGLTITRSFESVFLKPQFDFDVVDGQGPVLSQEFLTEFSQFCSSWSAIKGYSVDSIRKVSKVVGALTRGPNGNSIATAHYDAYAVRQDPNLKSHLERLASLTGNSWIYRMMIEHGSHRPAKPVRSGRISLVSQGGGKTRMIAIGDYWSQNILRPLHDSLMAILKGMETDATDQEPGFKRIMAQAGNESFSFDLTAATDRFPVALQEILLSKLYNDRIARAWRNVLTDRVFSYKKTAHRWAYGQPLGLLSSWAAFSLTHHAIIEFAAWRKGYKSFRKYAVLGDDVVIWDKVVAASYREIMDYIGVSINMAKSLFGDETTQRIEFSKRILFNGMEITGLKPNLLDKCSRSIYMFPDLVEVTQLRHWNLPWSEIEVPSHLSNKGREILAILLTDKIGLVPAFAVTLDANLDTLPARIKFETTRERISSIIRKSGLIEDNLALQDLRVAYRPTPTIKEELLKRFNGGGISISECQLGTDEGLAYPHPIRWALNQFGEELVTALDKIEACLKEKQFSPDEFSVEYLPTLTAGAYFGNRNDFKTRFHSSLVVTAWSRMKRENVEGGSTVTPSGEKLG